MLRNRDVTFKGDLRTNGGRYAVTLLGVALYFAMTALGASLWLAVLLPVLVGAGLGFVVRRRRR
jgi:hypothetical protein